MRDMEKKKANDARRHSERMANDLDYRMRKLWNSIKQRCTPNKHKSDRYYAAKGIQNFLTHEDLVVLWIRDGAYAMTRPTIDRIDGNDDYNFDNCRFIEHADNVRRGRKPL